MKKIGKQFYSALLVGTVLGISLSNATAAIQAWDPHGTTSIGGDGVWDLTTKNWTAAGTQSQVAASSLALWNSVGTNAALFCAGPSGSASTGNFIITVNSAIPMGGVFNGPLTPAPCTVTFQGTGSFNITPASSGVAAFATFNPSVGNTIINIPITGTSKVCPEYTGQIFLNGTNTYSGGTLLGFSSPSFTGILNFAGSSSFGTGNIIVSNTAGGFCGLVAEGTSAVNITNKWTWSALGGGVNIVGNPAGVTFSGTVAFGAGTTNAILFSGGTGNLVNMSGIISGGKAGGFVNFGNPLATGCTLKLSGVNSHALTSTISNCVLQAGNNTCIPINSSTPDTGKGDLWVYSPGIFDINGFSPTVSALVGDGTIDNKSATTGTFSAGTNNTSSTFNGTIQNTTGVLNFSKVGTGTLTLAGTSTYSGNTTLTGGGTLVAQNGNTSIPQNSPVIITGGSTLDVAFNSMTITNLSGGRGNIINNSGTITIVGNSTTNSSVVTYSGFGGNIDGGTLIKNGNATMSLRGLCNLSGGVQLNGGKLSVGAGPDRISSNGGATLSIADGATFQLDAATQTVAQISGTGFINLGSGTLNVNTTSGNVYSGVIQDCDLGATPVLPGHGLRGYYYDNQDFTVLKAVRDDANVSFTDLTNATQMPAQIYPNVNQISVRWLGQVLTTSAGTYTFSLTSDEGVRLWIGGTNVIDGWTTTSSTRTGTITLDATTRYDVVLEYFHQTGAGNCSLAWTPPGDTASAVIPTDYLFLPGAGSLVKDGAGSLQLTANNTYTGSTIVKAGTLEASADGALGASSVTVQDLATLSLDSGSANNYIADSADLILTASAAVSLNFNGTDTIRALSLDGGATYQSAGTYGAPGSGAQHEDSRFTGSGTITVTGKPSTTTLGSSTGSTVYGSTVTLTAVAHGSGATPTGTITFFDGANAIGTVAVDGTGTAVLNVSDLLVTTSPHSVTAVYNGDSTYGASASSAATQTVTPLTVTGVVGTTKQYDQTITAFLNATNLIGVLASDSNLVHIATGYTATFPDKNVGTNKAVTASGISLAGSLAGNYTIADTASTFGAVTAKPLTVTNITASNKIYDGTVNATVDASNGGITGSGTNIIYLGDDASPNLAAATGVFTSATVGSSKTINVTVPLTGADAGNYTATGTAKANVTIATSALALSSSANPANAGDNVNFTATASPLTGAGTPTGNVIFLNNGVAFATVALSGGSANSGDISTLPQGTNTITAQYASSANFVGSTNTLQQVINHAVVQPPTMTISNSAGQITITWSGTFNLQSVSALQSSGTAWQTIAGATSPYTTPTTNAAAFYRLSN